MFKFPTAEQHYILPKGTKIICLLMTEVTWLSVLSIAHITTKFKFEIKRVRELGVWTTQFALILYFTSWWTHSTTDWFTNNFSMPFQLPFVCCFIITCATFITNSFICWGFVLSEGTCLSEWWHHTDHRNI